MFAADDDYRVPDLVSFPEVAGRERGVDGAPVLVVEIRSPGDDTDGKVPWYLARGADEVLVVDRDTLRLELFRSSGPVAADDDGSARLESLHVTITPGQGTLRVDDTLLDI